MMSRAAGMLGRIVHFSSPPHPYSLAAAVSRRNRSPLTRRFTVERLERRDLLAIADVYREDFENGDGGFVVDNTGGSVLGLWHYSVGRRNDGLPNHTPTHNFYYGMFETSTGGGRYDVLPFDHQGTLTSPPIMLPDCGELDLRFSYVLDTRPELDRDFAAVSVITSSGTTQILSRQDGTLPETGNQWLTANADLSAFRGQEIHLVFSFRTGIPPNVDPEGWYVDDILITSDCAVVDQTADLSVQKSASDLTPDELQTITYTLVAANSLSSTAPATGVVVTDNLPAGVTFVSSVAGEGTYDPITDTWTGLVLDPGESRTLTITVTVNVGTAGQTLTNTATIDGNQPDPNVGNNTSTVQVVVNSPASIDLSVQKTVDDPTPSEGQLIAFTITVASAATSSGPATGMTVTDNLPTGVTFVAATASEGTYNPATDVWSGIALAPGESQTLTITVTVNAGAAGQALSNTAIVAGPDPDPQPGNNQSTVTLAVESVVQFIAPLSLYRLAGPFPPPAPSAVSPPNAGLATIKGFKWHDVDQDGVWDAGEPGRAGWEIYLDANGDNVFDPQAEPFAITATDGSYVFANLTPGTYFIREDTAGLSDGIFQVQRFPAADPAGQRDPDEHRVTLAANQLLEGHFGVAETPNFGTFDYSPLIRPADDFPGHFAVQTAAEQQTFLSATRPWQAFPVTNSTARPLRITAINQIISTSPIAQAGQFVRVFQRTAGGTLITPTFPIALTSGATVEFFAFYDPAIRSGNVVTAQYPDWFDDSSTTSADQNESRNRPPHTFATEDRLEVVTEYTDVAGSGPTFAAKLVGGSTYDSDIFYDGAVENADVARLADLLAAAAFDQTSDMNARLPNGASSTVNSQAWPINGPPPREIGLGDFAPLNIEFGRTRSPFLDLDTDDSTAQGVDFSAELTAGSAPVADFDSRFANRAPLRLASMTLTVTNPLDGAAEDFNFAGLPAGITGSSQFSAGVRTLTLTGLATVEAYTLALRGITYTNSDATPTAGTRVIRIQATGGNDFQFAWEGSANAGFDPRIGNVAFARILIKPAVSSSLVAEPEPEAEGEAAAWAADCHAPAAVLAHSASATTTDVVGPLLPQAWAALLASKADFSWESLAASILWHATDRDSRDAATTFQTTQFAAATGTLAPACHDEQAAIDLLLAALAEDDLDLLAGLE
jgi:uncharacterized repeat protein (TIGR01451 family)